MKQVICCESVRIHHGGRYHERRRRCRDYDRDRCRHDHGRKIHFQRDSRYLRDRTYPVGYSKADKTALRKRANFFVCKGSDLFYVGGQSSRMPEDRREPRLVIEDAGRRKRIVASLHDGSHLGVNRTLDLVTEKYYWPGLTAAVKDYVSDFDHNY